MGTIIRAAKNKSSLSDPHVCINDSANTKTNGPNPISINHLLMDQHLELAYNWICEQRKQRSHNNSIWDLRFNWEHIKPQLQQQLVSEQFRLSPLQNYTIDGQLLSSWTAVDSLVLKSLDDALSEHGFYIRFMDDWLIMVKAKRQLRKIIKLTHRILNQITLKMHPDKTFIGCIKKGFDFLGIHFGETPEISKTSLENHRSKLARRYAQGANSICIGHYLERWTSWCNAMLRSCRVNLNDSNPDGNPSCTYNSIIAQHLGANHEKVAT